MTITRRSVAETPPGPLTVTATVWYSKVVASVAEFLAIPPPEAEPVRISEHRIRVVVVPAERTET